MDALHPSRYRFRQTVKDAAPMGKLLIFPLLIAVAAFAAATFGALHNQISYTVGPTYFTEFKFIQFHVSENIPHRLGAGYVGVMASWWMGPLIGLPAFIYGLFSAASTRRYLSAGLTAVGIVVLLATIGATLGFIGGILADTTGFMDDMLTLPDGANRADFLRAGFMHDASYLAGALGLIAAFLHMRRARASANPTQDTHHAT